MPDVALSMIVRNEAKMLRGCLESLRGVVQELVIADTGSADETVQIAREFGARVLNIPWENDFAAARNRALEGITSEWILSLDADERLDAESVSAIASAIGGTAAAYQVTIRNYVLSLEDRIWDRPAQPNDNRLAEARAYPAFVDHENVRLFRRAPEIYFVGRVHESVGPRVQASGLPLEQAPFLIHHLGLTADEHTRANKNILYRELGRKKVLECPQDAQAHLELGLVELDNFGNLAEALACFEKACVLNSRFGVAWFFGGVTELRRRRPAQALSFLKRAEECGHRTAAVAELTGDALYNLGEFAASTRAYRTALKRLPLSVQVESKLGLALVRMGKADEGLQRTIKAVHQRPGVGDLHDRLVQSLVWLKRVPEAATAAENKIRSVSGTSSEDFVRAASLWNQTGSLARAVAVLHVGLQIHSGDVHLEEALTELRRGEEAAVNRLVTALQNGTHEPYRH